MTDNEDIKFHLGHPVDAEDRCPERAQLRRKPSNMTRSHRATSKMLSTTMIKYWKLSEKFAGMSLAVNAESRRCTKARRWSTVM